METTAKQPKKWNKKLWISLASIALAIAIVVIVLACVKVAPSERLAKSDISSVTVIKDGTYDWTGSGCSSALELVNVDDTDSQADLDAFLAAYNKATEYSVGYGILNNVWSNTIETNGDEDPRDPSDIKALKGTAEDYMAVVKYGDVKTAEVAGEEVTYDYMIFFVRDTESQLKRFAYYLVDGSKIGGDVEGEDEDYGAVEYRGVMNGNVLRDCIDELIKG